MFNLRSTNGNEEIPDELAPSTASPSTARLFPSFGLILSLLLMLGFLGLASCLSVDPRLPEIVPQQFGFLGEEVLHNFFQVVFQHGIGHRAIVDIRSRKVRKKENGIIKNAFFMRNSN